MADKRTLAQLAALEYGYRRGNDDTRWYAGRGGLLEMPFPLELRIEDHDETPIAVYAKQYGGIKQVCLLRFTDWPSFTDYLQNYGIVAKPGMPTFSNSWD